MFVVESAPLDAMLAGQAVPSEELRFPGHVLVYRGPLLADLLRLWVHDEAVTVSEPHVVVASGQSAAIALMSVGPEGKPVELGRRGGRGEDESVGTDATLRPKIKGDGSIEMALSLRTSWSQPMSHVVTPGNKTILAPGAADAFATTIDLPAIGLRSDQQLMVRGWDISGGRLLHGPDDKWETLLVVTARPN